MEAVLCGDVGDTDTLWLEAFPSDDEKIKNGLELEMEDASSSTSVISNSVKELSTLESLAIFSATKSSVWVPEVLLLGFLFIFFSSFLLMFARSVFNLEISTFLFSLVSLRFSHCLLVLYISLSLSLIRLLAFSSLSESVNLSALSWTIVLLSLTFSFDISSACLCKFSSLVSASAVICLVCSSRSIHDSPNT